MGNRLPVAASLAALSVLVPAPWLWRIGQAPALYLLLWLFVSNVVNAINTAVWNDDYHLTYSVWCDIVTKVIVATNFAIPSCFFCIALRLRRLSSFRHTYATERQLMRRRLLEALLCMGSPLACIALHFAFQGNRYDIIEGLGCRPNTINTIAATVFVYGVPLLMSLVAFVLAALALDSYRQRRVVFRNYLATKCAPTLTMSGYVRLMLLVFVLVTVHITMTSVQAWIAFRHPLHPAPSSTEGEVDLDYLTRVHQVTIEQLSPLLRLWLHFRWWPVPVIAFVFFAILSFGNDVGRIYLPVVRWVRSYLDVLRPRVPEDQVTSEIIEEKRKHSFQDVIDISPSYKLFNVDLQGRSSDYTEPSLYSVDSAPYCGLRSPPPAYTGSFRPHSTDTLPV